MYLRSEDSYYKMEDNNTNYIREHVSRLSDEEVFQSLQLMNSENEHRPQPGEMLGEIVEAIKALAVSSDQRFSQIEHELRTMRGGNPIQLPTTINDGETTVDPENEDCSDYVLQLPGMNTDINRCNSLRSVMKKFNAFCVKEKLNYKQHWLLLESITSLDDDDRAELACGRMSMDDVMDVCRHDNHAEFGPIRAEKQGDDVIPKRGLIPNMEKHKELIRQDKDILMYKRDGIEYRLHHKYGHVYPVGPEVKCDLAPIDKSVEWEDVSLYDRNQILIERIDRVMGRRVKEYVLSLDDDGLPMIQSQQEVELGQAYPGTVMGTLQAIRTILFLDTGVLYDVFPNVQFALAHVPGHSFVVTEPVTRNKIVSRLVGMNVDHYSEADIDKMYVEQMVLLFKNRVLSEFIRDLQDSEPELRLQVRDKFTAIWERTPLIALSHFVENNTREVGYTAMLKFMKEFDKPIQAEKQSADIKPRQGIIGEMEPDSDATPGTKTETVFKDEDVTMVQAADVERLNTTAIDTPKPTPVEMSKAVTSDERSLRGYLERWRTLGRVTWDNTQTNNTELKRYEVFKDFIPAPAECGGNVTRQMLSALLMLYTHVEVMIMLTGSKFHLGMLQLSYLPFTELRNGTSRVSKTGFSHVWGQASKTAEMRLRIDWNMQQPVMNLVKVGNYNTTLMGYVKIDVFEQLVPPSGGNNKISFTVQTRFVGPIAAIPRDATLIAQGPDMDDISNGIETVKSIAEVAGMLLDKPTMHHQSINQTRLTTMANLACGTGPDGSTRLDLHAQSCHIQQADSVGGTVRDMNVHGVASRPMVVHVAPVTTAMVQGQEIWQFPISPMVADATFLAAGSVYRPTFLSSMAGLFTYWRGKINVNIEVVSTQMHVFKFMVVQMPGYQRDAANASSVNYELLKNFPNIEFEVRESTAFAFAIDYNHDTPWCFVHGLVNVASGNAWGVVNNNIYAPAATGTIKVILTNELESAPNISDTVQMVFSLSAGEDFEVCVPAPIDTRWVDKFYLSGDDPNRARTNSEDTFEKVQAVKQGVDDIVKPSSTHRPIGRVMLPSITAGDGSLKRNETHPVNRRGYDLRDLMKRYSVTQRGHVKNSDGAFHIFDIPCFPNYNNQAYAHILLFLSEMYTFYCGSMRFKLNVNIPNNASLQAEAVHKMSMPSVNRTAPELVYPNTLVFAHDFFSSETSDIAHYNGLAFHIENFPLTKVIEIETPYHSIYPFSYCGRSNDAQNNWIPGLLNATHRVCGSHLQINLEFCEGGQQVEAPYDFLVAAGDDFMFHYLVPRPSITLKASPNQLFYGLNQV